MTSSFDGLGHSALVSAAKSRAGLGKKLSPFGKVVRQHIDFFVIWFDVLVAKRTIPRYWSNFLISSLVSHTILSCHCERSEAIFIIEIASSSDVCRTPRNDIFAKMECHQDLHPR